MRKIPLLKILLLLIGLHSLILGLVQWFLSEFLIEIFQISGLLSPAFATKQGGVFLIILGIAYLIAGYDPKRYPGLVWLVVISKALAVAFLLSEYFLYAAPPIILWVGFGDGAMGVAVIVVKRIEEINEKRQKASTLNSPF